MCECPCSGCRSYFIHFNILELRITRTIEKARDFIPLYLVVRYNYNCLYKFHLSLSPPSPPPFLSIALTMRQKNGLQWMNGMLQKFDYPKVGIQVKVS